MTDQNIKFLSVFNCSKKLGITPAAFLGALRDGRITRSETNEYEVELVRKELMDNTKRGKRIYFADDDTPNKNQDENEYEPEYESKTKKKIGRPSPNIAPEGETFEDLPDDLNEILRSGKAASIGINGNRTLAEANRIQAWQKVQREQMEVDLRMAAYVSLAEVNQHIVSIQIKAKDLFTRIAPELKDQLAQESDPVNIEYMLGLEINRALTVMSEFKPAEPQPKKKIGRSSYESRVA